jgi:hypothetical protein
MKSSRIVGGALCLALAALLGPKMAFGQFESGQWRATPIVGVIAYDNATPYKTAPMIGGTVMFSVNQVVSVGIGTGLARPQVDGSYFPRALFQLGSSDSTFLFNAGYQASQWNYYGQATVGLPLGSFYLQALGGIGGITTWIDREAFYNVAQKTSGSTGPGSGRSSFTNLFVPVGVGISWALSSTIGLRFDAVDEIYSSFDRDLLNPIAEARFENTCEAINFCIPDANGTPPEAKSTVHNFRFSLGFEFAPGR